MALISPGVGNRWSVRSLPAQTILGFWDMQIPAIIFWASQATFAILTPCIIQPHLTSPALSPCSAMDSRHSNSHCNSYFLQASIFRETWLCSAQGMFERFQTHPQFGYQEVPQQSSIIPHKDTALLEDKVGFPFIVSILNSHLLDLFFLLQNSLSYWTGSSSWALAQ